MFGRVLRMVKIRSGEELKLMRKSGWIGAKAMKKVLGNVRSGVTLLHLDRIAKEEIRRLGGTGAFLSVAGYNFTTCLSLNNEIVHGTPRAIPLKKGDILSIDLGAGFEGWFTDMAWSIVVDDEPNNFLLSGEKALWAGVAQAVHGKKVGDISDGIQHVLEVENNYFVSRSLIGHGIGQKLHEEPEIPGFGKKGTGSVLQSGMTLAIEAIYTERESDVEIGPDKWAVVSNGGNAAMFEMTVVVGADEAEVLTDWRAV